MTRPDGVLVVGYGSPLRRDDAVGWHVATSLAADPRLADARVLSVHQLLPELALDVSEAELVVLVDARAGVPPGSITVERPAPSDVESGRWTHHLTPAALIALARDLGGGGSPEVVVVGVGVATTEPGDELSDVVSAAVPRVHEVVADLVLTHA
jgi:hydrogenase maturation protease